MAEFERKSRINAEFVRLYEEAQASEKHGHYENMFHAMHQAYASAMSPPDDGFHASDFAEVASLIRHGKDFIRFSGLRDNDKVILAALDRAS